MISFATSYSFAVFASLFAVLLGVLLLLRLYRTRRVEVLAGSLLLWRRLAAQQPRVKPPRVLIDRSLLLQTAALLALVVALAAPNFDASTTHGRGLLLVLDNAPAARARTAQGEPRWQALLQAAEQNLARLSPDDRVFIALSSPAPKQLNAQGLPPAEAAQLLKTIAPALTVVEAQAVWQAAINLQRAINRQNQTALTVLSPNGPPAGITDGRWLTVAPRTALPGNAGIVQFGAAAVVRDGKAAVQVLARVQNFSATPLDGTLQLEVEGQAPQSKPLKLDAHEGDAAVFEVPAQPARPLQIRWRAAGNAPDALPEDDLVVAAPQPVARISIRFHSPLPALQKLYAKALDGAALLDAAGTDPADLEIFVGNVPDAANLPRASRALLLIAPPTGYQSNFDVGDKILTRPRVQLSEESPPLTLGLKDSPEGLFPVAKAREILRTGNFKTILKDGNATDERALLAVFRDDAYRQCYLLSFVPGDGFPAEQPLHPTLAALLLRMALQAAGTAEPYIAVSAPALEEKLAAPLPLDWQPPAGTGVLSETTSAAVGHAPEPSNALPMIAAAGLPPLAGAEQTALAPYLIALALLLVALDLSFDLPVRRASVNPGEPTQRAG